MASKIFTFDFTEDPPAFESPKMIESLRFAVVLLDNVSNVSNISNTSNTSSLSNSMQLGPVMLATALQLVLTCPDQPAVKPALGLLHCVTKQALLGALGRRLDPAGVVKLVLLVVVSALREVSRISGLFEFLNFLNRFLLDFEGYWVLSASQTAQVYQCLTLLVQRLFEFEFLGDPASKSSDTSALPHKRFFRIDSSSRLPLRVQAPVFAHATLSFSADTHWKESLRKASEALLLRLVQPGPDSDSGPAASPLRDPPPSEIESDFKAVYARVVYTSMREIPVLRGASRPPERLLEDSLTQSYQNSLMLLPSVILHFCRGLAERDRADMLAQFYDSIVSRYLLLHKQEFSALNRFGRQCSSFDFFGKFVLALVAHVLQFLAESSKHDPKSTLAARP